MKKLALALALACASCVAQKAMDLRLIPIASDAELIAESRGIQQGLRINEIGETPTMDVWNEVHAELARRWVVDASAVTAAVAGRVSLGLPERAVLLLWGEPVSRERIDEAETWHYRMMAGQEPRRVVFRAGIVSEVYPPGGY